MSKQNKLVCVSVVILLLTSLVLSRRGNEIVEEHAPFTIDLPRYAKDRINGFLEDRQRKEIFNQYRERLNNEEVNDFKNSMGEAMSEMEVSMSEMLGIETKKKKKRLWPINGWSV